MLLHLKLLVDERKMRVILDPPLWRGLYNAQVTLPRSALNCIDPCRSPAVTVEASLAGERFASLHLTEVLAGTTKAYGMTGAFPRNG
ncbi:hypothetical protein XEUV490_10100 [Xanthomonas euvesicatoria]|nr:hypothetical protein XEUV315_07620 [Xanthomonas euvesicatoria]KLB72021.1 hypothetical protein XEUV490_10100 [Xanthomonas euvesicatoria]KLB84632.1 hypothetical protein XEUV586_04260 [Xanthomonas euvesicatoria]KLB89549.1 hypothetical protein XEUV678_20275 [Xanthomonas euvesicatoria]PIB18426.1 hypothetical protein AA099_00235 [Xanthomonas citri pv. citri]